MVFLLILTLCGDPHIVLIGDGVDPHYQFWSKLPDSDRRAVQASKGAEIEIWPGKCS